MKIFWGRIDPYTQIKLMSMLLQLLASLHLLPTPISLSGIKCCACQQLLYLLRFPLSMFKVGWFTCFEVGKFQIWTVKQSPCLFLCPASHSHMPHLFMLWIKSAPKNWLNMPHLFRQVTTTNSQVLTSTSFRKFQFIRFMISYSQCESSGQPW